ncbi:restriction endonuclease subunit S [Gordonia alkanivorans]|uniref:restriction endonuclease subunit S n=1 Tax=Gordonia alkanivorans TaxID=84096 RepID=UPI0024491347|nr:restriction endonuclease subunit S [Gordonia alkanivorans]MDH3052541.1 restriction endonuclease subunit S [Gordonia alkanivorans]
MNRTTFLDCFGHIVDAPGGIDQLRRIVLALAVRGRLTHQDSDDEPAAVLLERISAERSASVRRKTKRRSSADQLLTTDPDHALPLGWSWAHLAQVGDFVGGNGFPKEAQEGIAGPIPFCKVSDMNRPGNERWIHTAANCVTAEVGKKLRATAHKPGTVIFPKIGGAIATNKRRQLVVPTFIDNNCMGVSPCSDLSSDWLFVLLLSVDMTKYQAGTSLPAVSQRALSTLAFGLPPVAEQHRIVERVDELMGFCDELEEQRTARTGARLALTDAALHRVAGAETADDLHTAVNAFTSKLDLHLAPGDGDRSALKRLRQTILDLAVRGRLTHQDPADEPALDLLDQIAAERDRLVRAKKIRKPKKFAEASDRSSDPDLPAGWAWARADEFFIASDSGWSPRCVPESAAPGEWGVLKTSAVSRGAFDQYENKKLPAILEPRAQLEVMPGDFVMIRASGSKSLVGRGAIVTETKSHLMLSDKHIRLSFLHEASTRFWAILNDSSAVQSYYSDESSGTSTMSNVTRDRIGALVVAVPPLAEQLRIAERVDKLLGLCDELGQLFLTAEAARIDLAASVVAHATPQREASLN